MTRQYEKEFINALNRRDRAKAIEILTDAGPLLAACIVLSRVGWSNTELIKFLTGK